MSARPPASTPGFGRIDITGQRFGRLTALRYLERRGKATFWLLRCDCGQEHEAAQANLRMGTVSSCGCLRRELARQRRPPTKHGASPRGLATKLYGIWRTMRGKCRNRRHFSYRYYGGRGITVCEAWHDYATFRAWAMANGYAEGLSIDRIDPDGHYEPANCRWITRGENARRARPAYSVMAGTGKPRKKRTTPYVRDASGRFGPHKPSGT